MRDRGREKRERERESCDSHKFMESFVTQTLHVVWNNRYTVHIYIYIPIYIDSCNQHYVGTYATHMKCLAKEGTRG